MTTASFGKISTHTIPATSAVSLVSSIVSISKRDDDGAYDAEATEGHTGVYLSDDIDERGFAVMSSTNLKIYSVEALTTPTITLDKTIATPATPAGTTYTLGLIRDGVLYKYYYLHIDDHEIRCKTFDTSDDSASDDLVEEFTDGDDIRFMICGNMAYIGVYIDSTYSVQVKFYSFDMNDETLTLVDDYDSEGTIFTPRVGVSGSTGQVMMATTMGAPVWAIAMVEDNSPDSSFYVVVNGVENLQYTEDQLLDPAIGFVVQYNTRDFYFQWVCLVDGTARYTAYSPSGFEEYDFGEEPANWCEAIPVMTFVSNSVFIGMTYVGGEFYWVDPTTAVTGSIIEPDTVDSSADIYAVFNTVDGRTGDIYLSAYVIDVGPSLIALTPNSNTVTKTMDVSTIESTNKIGTNHGFFLALWSAISGGQVIYMSPAENVNGMMNIVEMN